MNLPIHIKKMAGLSAADEKDIALVFNKQTLEKGTVLFDVGETCRHIYFVEKGLVRSYYSLQNGKEITAWFSPEQSFFTAIDTFYKQKPTNLTSELVEDSEIYSITFSQLDEMLNKNHAMAKFAFHTILDVTQKKSEYTFNLKFQTAQERYEALLAEYPQIFQRVQLKHIASFLGITPETLSRLRAI